MMKNSFGNHRQMVQKLSYGVEPNLGRGPVDYEHLEISGYFLHWLVIQAMDGNSFADSQAHRTMEFILQHQHLSGSFPHSIRKSDNLPPRDHEHHVFDAGIIASALHHYGQYFGHADALNAGLRACQWTLDATISDRVTEKAVYDVKDQAWDKGREGYWSSQGGCYLGKLLITWCRYGFDEQSVQYAKKWVDKQRSDGSWVASKSAKKAHSHAMLYLLEGLLYFSRVKKRNSELDFDVESSIERGLKYLGDWSLRKNGITEWDDEKNDTYRSDSQIQYLRLCKVSGFHNLIAENKVQDRLEILSDSKGLCFSSNKHDYYPSWVELFRLSYNASHYNSIEKVV